MWENLFRHVNIRPENDRYPDGLASDVPAFCADYEARIRAVGGIDLQLLGIGSDGHIGFNEPSSSLASRTRIKTLTQRTRADSARFFASADEVPSHVITMGIGTIMEARTNLLLAFGAEGAGAGRSRRRTGHGNEPGLGAATASRYARLPRRGRGDAAQTGGLLSLGVRQQAAMAARLNARRTIDFTTEEGKQHA